MARAIDIARLFIQLAASEEEPELLSHLRLQKLLYYAQGWSLALLGRELFPEEIQAWAHGPVVPAVYPHFADYGYSSISPDSSWPVPQVTPDEVEFVESVWDAYKGFSAFSLRDLTHRDEPWISARKGHNPGDRCDVVISKDALRRYFGSNDGSIPHGPQ